MTSRKILSNRQISPAGLKLPSAAARQGIPKPPEENPSTAQAHVLASTADATALKNIKDERPVNYPRNFGGRTPAPPRSSDNDARDLGPPNAGNIAGGLPATASHAQRMSSLVGMGALPEYIEEAISSIPLGSEGQLRAFSLVREVGASPDDARQYACEDIPIVPGKPEQQARLDYCLGRAGGLSVSEAIDFCGRQSASNGAHFREAKLLPNAASDPSVKVNYCLLRAQGNSVEIAAEWASIGPGGGASLVRSDIDNIKNVYLQGAKLELRPGNFPRFVGNSIPAPDGKKILLGEGIFNQVELVRIIDPLTRQERNFAFKPSQPNPSIGRSGQLTGIAKEGFAPENRNLAAVAVARTLGLLGENGVTGDAFMGIVDGRLGLFMEVAPGKPMAKPSRDIRVDPRSNDYARLTKPSLKKQVISSPAVNLAQSNLLGVHSIRYDGNNVILTGSITDPNHPDNLEPFQNHDPSLKKAYSTVEIFHQLINEPDGHPGNLLVNKRVDDSYAIRAIDQDQAFGAKSNVLLGPDNAYMAYFLPVRARYIGKELADRMCLPATRTAMALAVSTHLTSQAEIDACMKRFDLIVESIVKGYITVIDDSDSNEIWRTVEMTNPRASLFARDGRRYIPAPDPNQQQQSN